jgi:NAD(P)H dehydrogenase (quinone)
MADIAVTGATGQLGGRIARRLAAQGAPQRLVVRDAARAPELPGAEVAVAAYGDEAAMRAALDGVSTLMLVSASEVPDRVALHRTAVEAALAAGVRRIIYTSFVGAAPEATFTFARHHWYAEEHLRSTGVAHTILRDNLYLDYFPLMVWEDGVIRGPGGDGRAAPVARDDIADAAVGVLLHRGDDHDGRTYDLTGPRAMTLHEVADELTRVTGREVRYRDETVEEAYASRARFGAPDWEVEGWVTTYVAMARGEMEVVTDHVERLAGHPPMSLGEYLAANPPRA